MVRLNVSATPEQHPPQLNTYTNNISNNNGQQNVGAGALNKNISSSSSSTSSLNSNASSFEPHHNQIQHQFQHQLLHHQHQQHNTSQVRQQRSTNNMLMVVPQQQQVQQTHATQQQAQYAHLSSLASQHQLPQQHSFTHHVHHQTPSQSNGVAIAIQQHQHKQQPPQQSPAEISTSSLPASPPLIQQTTTASQSAQLVQPVCAIHHPQQHQQQFALVAAMHQHLTAATGLGSLPPQHMHLSHGPQAQPQSASLQVQALTATSQQPQTTQHSQQLLKEKNHDSGYIANSGGVANQATGNSPGASSTESPTSGAGTSTGSSGSTNAAAQRAPSTPGQLYIQYPADFYPAEYYITPNSHDSMCPQHPHHHHAMCAMSTDYGPATVQMVSQNRPASITVPVQVPQGQMMQQYVNENGTFAHVVLSPQYQQIHSSQGHMHAPFMQAGGSSQFYPTLPTGFAPNPGGGPAHFHTLTSGHVQTQQLSQHQKATTQPQQTGSQTLSHSPSPPNSYYKDERTQRQHTKLLRKLEKQREMINSANNSPVNGTKKHDHVIATSAVLPSDRANSNSSVKSSIDNGLGVIQSVQNINKSIVQPKQDTSPLRQPLKKHILHSQTTQRNGGIASNTSQSGLSYGVNIASSKGDKGEFSSNVLVDEEDPQALIIEQLSAIQKPSVINLTSRSAKIIWEGPIITDSQIDTRNLRYNVLLSDRAKDGKYKSLYKGDSYDCIVQDLQPGQMYVVRVQVYYNKMQGTASEASEFMTPPCEPDQPMPPKLVMRTKNSLHLRWSNPPSNGSPIQHYLLEYDDGKSGLSLSTRSSRQNSENDCHNFVEATKTKGKHYTLTKLQPSTVYYFRLAAVNDVGMSLYSTICSYCTSNNPPIAPKPPKLQSSSSTTIRLWWERRQQDGDYVLQILDPDSGHGYLNAYNGPDTSHECCELRRATYYQFRLRAENEAGSSPWCNEVTYQTAPEKPGKPGKPHVKGKIHGTHFRARWDPPIDKGGAEIIRYFLEITSGAKFERIYSGTDTESICDRLQPGTTYQLRASCEGPAGISPYSDVAHITSEALVPAAPSPPYYDSPPGPYAAVLRLDKPENSGGAPILEFEVQMRHSVDDKYAIANKTNDYSIVYHGRDTFCVVKDLQPGWPYEVQVRAINRIGAGPWSSWFRFSAAAAPPNVPENLNVIIKSATHLLVNWEEPCNNGAPIQEYRLESLTLENESENENSSHKSVYLPCYHGGQTSIDLRNLSPFTIYYFRVNASNAAGVSKWSTCIQARTPAAVPAAPQIKDCEFTAKKVVLNWSKPECNGAYITGYTIECAEKSITTADANTTYTIHGLIPETTYKIRLQAFNSIGCGPFSSYTKFTTLPSPPPPPTLECTGVGHNFIKLKWGDGKNVDFIKYYVEMFVQRAKEFQIVYSGTSCMCKVNKLQESTAYTFRVYASTDRAGIGEFSDEYIFSTTPTLPSNIKAPRVAMEGAAACLLTHGVGSASSFVPSGILPETPTSFIAGLGNLSLGVPLTLEWQNSKNSFSDPVEYVLQYAIGKDGDYRRIYRGPETKFTIENLEPGTMYQFRVYPIRVTKSGEDLVGQYTSAFRYQVPHLAALDDIDGNLLGNMGSVFGTSAKGINNSNNVSMNCHGHSHLAHHVHSLHTHHSHSHTHHNSRQSTSSLHHRSVSASAASPNGFNGHNNTNISDSSNNSGSTILIGPNAIGLIPLSTSMANELTTVEFAGCDDPLHHHHHHHQFLGGNVGAGSDSVGSTPTTTSFLAAASNNLLTNNALLVHGIGSSNHTQHGVLRRYITKLTTIYTNRKRFTDQEKAVLFMVCFLFFTFIFATLVKALMR
ncbi:fibronectin type-III domain-containing protein 3A isoform X2 [Bactrocera neohumeralis]|uniref:fibronectin type-III domain-containing protein 3A isoform X2 n=1 Tax=Bactrocera neohumeralis TaxID=98809 RepID=UPI0021660183|nr:fibronectin type-III domain-containing protein 3A isoform X2 [Bactrocera neohumeralis]XP_050319104.1 fibronectin type-III domain-containing protein 3A isoform X2 [Bactrocera neohumeralis]XP_050319105.1 fibronectin type-III domain-containing protein 3A isoform X2 [Bactrocera neohumeralis]XP_050319106.1 fibronectin type-III domain-containing protein 3A isoform X2 [Bactrocera neohumeralis]